MQVSRETLYSHPDLIEFLILRFSVCLSCVLTWGSGVPRECLGKGVEGRQEQVMYLRELISYQQSH